MKILNIHIEGRRSAEEKSSAPPSPQEAPRGKSLFHLCEKEKVFHNVCKNFPLPDQRSPQVQSASNKVVRHISKILMTPQQYEIFTSHIRHRFSSHILLNHSF